MTTTKSTNAKNKLAVGPMVVRPGSLNRPVRVTKRRRILLTDTQKTVLVVSLVWLIIGATIVAFLTNSQAQYNRGVFDGMTKTRIILQGK